MLNEVKHLGNKRSQRLLSCWAPILRFAQDDRGLSDMLPEIGMPTPGNADAYGQCGVYAVNSTVCLDSAFVARTRTVAVAVCLPIVGSAMS
jgi:hypothetical protein